MLTTGNADQIRKLAKELREFRIENVKKQVAYEAKNLTKTMDSTIPPKMRSIRQAVGWAALACDALDERVEMEGFTALGEEDLEELLNDIFEQNALDVRGKYAQKNAFKFGIGFMVVGHGDTEAGEPEVLITSESPNNVAVRYNHRAGRVTEAIIVRDMVEGKGLEGHYMDEFRTVPFQITDDDTLVVQTGEEVYHGLGRVGVVPFVNRSEDGRLGGHSEITEPIIAIIDSMLRTLLGAEVAREFFAWPQRYLLGADPDMFLDDNGNPIANVELLMDRILTLGNQVIESNSPGGETKVVTPTVGQFPANDPRAHIEFMREYAQLFAVEAGLPTSYLGLTTANPSSADAIRVSENRLIKRAENRIAAFRRPWIQVAELALLVREGAPREGVRVTPQFRNPATLTQAAAVDSAMKLVAAGVLRPDSEIVLKMAGFSRREIEIIKAENAVASSMAFLNNLANPQAQPAIEGVVIDEEAV